MELQVQEEQAVLVLMAQRVVLTLPVTVEVQRVIAVVEVEVAASSCLACAFRYNS